MTRKTLTLENETARNVSTARMVSHLAVKVLSCLAALCLMGHRQNMYVLPQLKKQGMGKRTKGAGWLANAMTHLPFHVYSRIYRSASLTPMELS